MNIETAIQMIASRKTQSDPTPDEAITLIAKRFGNVESEDYDLLYAAEALALEVANLRLEKELAKGGF